MVEKVGREGMTELVRSDIEGNRRMTEILLQERVDRAGRESLSQFGEEEGAFVDFYGTSIGVHRLHGVGTDRDESLLLTLSHHTHCFRREINVIDIKCR